MIGPLPPKRTYAQDLNADKRFPRLAKRSELKRAKERMGDGVLRAIARGELVAMNPTDSEIATTREIK